MSLDEKRLNRGCGMYESFEWIVAIPYKGPPMRIVVGILRVVRHPGKRRAA